MHHSSHQTESQAEEEVGRSSLFRMLVDSIVTLAIAVILFRTFQAEGYMISTGSMAPSLLGYHKQVVCPRCQFSFAYGVAYDESVSANRFQAGEDSFDEFNSEASQHATCPNCDTHSIDLMNVPRNEGDQLLVFKHAYYLKAPQRWDVAVFQNPMKSTQAYVKRVVGLPGESVQVKDGDLYINGKIARKDLETQRAIRLVVYDHHYRPENDEFFQPRLIPVESELQGNQKSKSSKQWVAEGDGFTYDARNVDVLRQPESQEWAWVKYQHWMRQGGQHLTSVPLNEWPAEIERPEPVLSRIQYNQKDKSLSYKGAMSADDCHHFLGQTEDEEFRYAIALLYEQSHVAPILDHYGYNSGVENQSAVPVHDFMFQCDLKIDAREGEFAIEFFEGYHRFRNVFNFKERQVSLFVDDQKQPIRTGQLHQKFRLKSALIEMSVMDRQVMLAIDGQLVYQPLLYSARSEIRKEIRTPVRLGANGGQLHLANLKLYQDVHYTRGKALNGVDEPYQLDQQSYFMLGDNSPVSLDSRSWSDAKVEYKYLLGKPFLVHLPSRQGEVKIGNHVGHMRIPDFSRIRYIH